MVLNMKENGRKIVPGVKVNWFILMDLTMKETGCIIMPMDMVYLLVKMEASTKDSGEEISLMEKAEKLGLTVAPLKGSTMMGKRETRESIKWQEVIYMMAVGKMTSLMERDS
jgi:hypothetical protein